MTEIQNPKHLNDLKEKGFRLRLGHWILKFEIYL